MRIRWIDVMVLLAVVGYGGWKMANRPPKVTVSAASFAEQVDLRPLDRIAVHADGRLRSFESHAKTYMDMITGPQLIEGHTDGFTYLDLIFRPDQYVDEDIIYVKNKQVRAQLLSVLKNNQSLNDSRRETIMQTGLFSRSLLDDPAAQALLQQLGQDVIRTAKVVDAIETAMHLADARFLREQMRIVPPAGAGEKVEWLSVSEILAPGTAPQDAAHAGMSTRSERLQGLGDEFIAQFGDGWSKLQKAWRDQNVADTNKAIAQLASAVTSTSSPLYPSADRLSLESWYFRYRSMTWVWLIYVAAVIPLLMSVIYKWDRARHFGMVVFVIAFLFHTASLGVRWYISGRWPNANMFEAVTTAAWFGGVAAVFLEWFTRRTAFRNLFALGSAVMSMLALMAAYFLPADLTSAISNKMAALNDVWLYIHTNMIILSYALIGLACVPALLLLRHRWCLAWDQGFVPRLRLMLLPVVLVAFNYAAYMLTMYIVNDAYQSMPTAKLAGVMGVFTGSLMYLLFEMQAARARAKAGVRVDKAASGGASSLILSSRATSPFLRPEVPTSGQVLDGATMVLVELSFITLFVGTVMGAIWADHSWGRPWGWDPKEVFALNTFIIYLILVHVRFKVRDKALWTAVLSVVGFQVMMFNWIVVNFVISGLHSYA